MPAAVAGMNWAMPWAPAGLTARGSNPDSARRSAARRDGDRPFAVAADATGARYAAGTHAGTGDAAVPRDRRLRAPHPGTYPQCQGSHE